MSRTYIIGINITTIIYTFYFSSDSPTKIFAYFFFRELRHCQNNITPFYSKKNNMV